MSTFVPIQELDLPVIDAPAMARTETQEHCARIAEMYRQMHREVLRRMAITNGGRPKLEAVK